MPEGPSRGDLGARERRDVQMFKLWSPNAIAYDAFPWRRALLLTHPGPAIYREWVPFVEQCAQAATWERAGRKLRIGVNLLP